MDRQNVKMTIGRLLADRGTVTSAELQSELGLTRQALHYHLRDLVSSGVVIREGRGPAVRYRLPERRAILRSLGGLDEAVLWHEVLRLDASLEALDEGSKSILRYVFTEMVNNAIDHSRGTSAEVSWFWSGESLTVEVGDDGIGVFRTVQEGFDLPDELSAIEQISKGRTTIDPVQHTGQGIFFSSKAVDRFVIEANGVRWTIDNVIGDQAIGDATNKGSVIRFHLRVPTTRELKKVFDEYATPDVEGFSRTRVTVQLFSHGDSFVSRSEAKRVGTGLERFEEAIIDFANVAEVGQGFVDELFRVWAREHPGTRLFPVGMSRVVESMVRRGLAEK